ncbi:uncharacterized protein LOC106462321 isoform X2 [Limulus polyphemus]|nr:uncharacterized protein LOC106462321 isoform X2 [Limulus polyphemus]XP_022245244.1 uncharacterized protein LOC106462321 isoform X2 [Limulus polyphemus]
MLCDSRARGIKRKYGDDKECELPSSLYLTQRQEVFSISLCKRNKLLHTLSLRQSVLICNTLRKIQREFDQEGIEINCASNGHFIMSSVNPQIMTLDPPPIPSQTKLGCCPQKFSENTDYHEIEPNLLQTCPTDTSQPKAYSVNSYSLKSTLLTAYQNKPPSQAEEQLTRKLHDSSLVNSSLPKTCTTTTTVEIVQRQNGNTSAEECDRYLTEFDTPSGRITPFVKTLHSSSAVWNDDNDGLRSLNWSSVLNCNSSSTSAAISTLTTEEELGDDCRCVHSSASSESSGVFETSLHTLLPATCSPTSELSLNFSHLTLPSCSSPDSNSGSTSSSNSGYEIFGDIDMSLYDFDLYSPLSTPNVKLAPVSAEELMTSLT